MGLGHGPDIDESHGSWVNSVDPRSALIEHI